MIILVQSNKQHKIRFNSWTPCKIALKVWKKEYLFFTLNANASGPTVAYSQSIWSDLYDAIYLTFFFMTWHTELLFIRVCSGNIELHKARANKNRFSLILLILLFYQFYRTSTLTFLCSAREDNDSSSWNWKNEKEVTTCFLSNL